MKPKEDNRSEAEYKLLSLLLEEKGITPSDGSKLQPRENNTSLPLSFSQWRLWFLDQYEPGNPSFIIPSSYRLIGNLNKTALIQGVNEIIRRHEALRTIFIKVNGEPVQKILDTLKIPLESTDLRKLRESDKEKETRILVKAEIRKSFDLAMGPLIRARIFRLEENEYILTISVHHIVSDGWSMGIFIRELNILYEAFTNNEESPLAEIDFQYADFAIWQRNWLQGENLQKQLTYWRKQLASHPTLVLPYDYPRPTKQTFQGESLSLVLSKEVTDSLKLICKSEKATSFMILLAAFSIVLKRYSGQGDILIGTPIAGRNRIETENIIGFFLNSLILLIDLTGNPEFISLVKRVRKVALESYDNQDIPFEKIIEDLNPPRDLSRTPFYQVFFNMINIRSEAPRFQNLIVKPYRSGSNFSKFDLTVYAFEKNGSYRFTFTYNTDLFSKLRIREFLSHYEGLLTQIAAHPEKRISEYILLNASSQKILPDPTEPQSSKWYGTIHAKVSDHALDLSDKTAIVDKNGNWSYKDLDVYSDVVAGQLIFGGIKPHDIVAVYAHRSSNLVAAILGIHKAGGAFMILDPAYPALRLDEYLRLGNPKGFIYLEENGKLPNAIENALENLNIICQISIPINWTSGEKGSYTTSKSNHLHFAVSPDDPAYVAFTSGSTGKPKGIIGRHGSLSHFLPWQQTAFNLNTSDRFSMLSGLSHDPLHRDIFTSLWVGATLYIPDPDKFAESGYLSSWIISKKITFIHLTPAMGQYIWFSADKSIVLDSIRYFFFVGDKLTHNDVVRMRSIAPQAKLINSYGSTETQRAVGYYVIPPAEDSDISNHHRLYPVGRGIPNVQLLLINEEKQMCGIGELGEIYVRSPHLALSYLRDKSLTNESFLPNPFTGDSSDRLYKTGDLGRYLPDGNIEYSGRRDKQVKIRGFRIELSEIESVIIKNPSVKDVVVMAKENEKGLMRLIAYIISTDGTVPNHQELRNFIMKTLPEHMVPSAFIFLDKYPLTPNGKLDYDSLPESVTNNSDLDRGYLGPRTSFEEIITKIWSDIIGLQKIGVQDNFYDLGGHSLLAIQIIARIEEILGKSIPLSVFLQSPTVEGLANEIQTESHTPEISYLVPIQTGGDKPPLFCVPAAASTAMRFKLLSKYLGLEQPLYGFDYPGMDGKSKPLVQIQDMAKTFISELLKIQPQGPYFLAGMCYGGNVAFEMAQQLKSSGHQVAFLGILDSNYAPKRRRTLPYYYHKTREFINQKILGNETKPGEFIRMKKNWRSLSSDPVKQRINLVFRANIIARLGHSSPPYPGKITKFSTRWVIAKRATEQWRRATSYGLEDHLVPGTHQRRNREESGIMDEPNVQVLAQKIQECLSQAHG
jgi:amino acid adenylation domain-containing protein